MKNIRLRLETPADQRKVEEITREAFWNLYVPGCDEHYLAHTLRQMPAFIAELDFVAELGEKIVGNIMYARASIMTDDGWEHEVLTFGPVSVLPEYQKQGIGSALIRHTLALARDLGHRVVLIYGDPDYYCRFGFVAAEGSSICGAEGWFSPALQALELAPGALQGISGTFDEGEAYRIDPEAAAAFDLSFPPRAREEKPSHARYRELLSQAHR